jgi:hypothetical protein
MWFRFKAEWKKNEKVRYHLAFSLFPYRLMNEFAKIILVLFKIAIPKSNKHQSSILQFGLNSSFT